MVLPLQTADRRLGNVGQVILYIFDIVDQVNEYEARHVIPRIEPVRLTNLNKAQLIQRLIVAIEQQQIAWPAPSPVEGTSLWPTLTAELKRYEYQITPSGNITYNAPAGYHGDCVIALALANAQRYQFKPTGAIDLVTPAPKAARRRVLAG